MATWATLAGREGSYISPAYDLSLFGDGAISTIEWDAKVDEDTWTQVQTSISYDGGNTWQEFKSAFNGSSIQDINSSTNLDDAKIKFKVKLGTRDSGKSPIFHNIDMNIIPVIEFDNKGDRVLRPEMWIEKIGLGDVRLINISNNNKIFEFVGLADREVVYINNEKEIIESSLAKTYRYDSFNDNYLELVYGANVLRIIGDCKIQFRYQFITLQG